MMESMNEKVGTMVPLILGVGNHDVGLNEMPGINITINLEGPSFFTYFPQHFDRDENDNIIQQIPPINHRRTMFYHTFSDILYISLDSGYLHDFAGYQENWLVSTLNEFKDKKVKQINYHVPIYR